MRIRERVVTFGPGQTVIGIETRVVDPAGAARPPDRPGVLLLNAGVVYRVGPHRLTVNLARHFARAGYVALRFDFSGLGDSRPRQGTTYQQAVLEDVRAAMDQMQKSSGIDRFILGGVCSGADNSVRAALVDERVVGIVLLDPYAYRTPGFYVRYYLARLGRLRAWTGAAQRASRALLKIARAELARRRGLTADVEVPGGPQYRRYHPPRHEFAAQLRQLLDRGTAIYIAYSGSLGAVYNYAAQFDEAFRPYGVSSADLRCTFDRDVNHTYTELAAQQRLGDALVAWAGGISKGSVAARVAAAV